MTPCYTSPVWKPCSDDVKSYDFSASGNDLTRSICMWLGGWEVYDSGMGINLLVFDSPVKARQHLFLSIICHIGHGGYHGRMVQNLLPPPPTSGSGEENHKVLLCMGRPETKSEKRKRKKKTENMTAEDSAQAHSPNNNGFRKSLPNGNFLCLVHDSDGKSFLCFMHRSASAAGVPDLSSKAKSFYVRIDDPTLVRRQTRPTDDLGGFPPVPPLELFSDSWGGL